MAGSWWWPWGGWHQPVGSARGRLYFGEPLGAALALAGAYEGRARAPWSEPERITWSHQLQLGFVLEAL
ncbi:MAG TPA: hypothetical protein ENK18_16690 [Deltaproteobacteria bacterium]|nr:hypothetical protein [Deltaproteobacteria bacterium]